MFLFRKAAAGELAEDSGLSLLAKQTDVDVGQVGVTGAASFFESKVSCTSTTSAETTQSDGKQERLKKNDKKAMKNLRGWNFRHVTYALLDS